MELELGLALPTPRPPPASGKRVFGDAFPADAAKATLPLFFAREDDDDGGRGRGDSGGAGDHETSNKKRLVGWPPVKCAHRRAGGGGYVKVNMEGVAIGRKVDVSLHGSYAELLRTLRRMFPTAGDHQRQVAGRAEGEPAEGRRRRCGHEYVVTYEDGDGDWLLVGDDVPWEAFAKSVKRLRILA